MRLKIQCSLVLIGLFHLLLGSGPVSAGNRAYLPMALGSSAAIDPEPGSFSATLGYRYEMGVQIQNVSDFCSTAVVIEFRDPHGRLVGTYRIDSLGPRASRTLYPLPLAATFTGGAMVTASCPLAVEANVLASQLSLTGASRYFVGGDSYQAVTAASTVLVAPVVHRDNGRFFSDVVVQNTGAQAQNITVDFRNTSTGVSWSDTKLVEAGGTRTFALQRYNVGKFWGTATIRGSLPVAAVVTQERRTQIYDPASATGQFIVYTAIPENQAASLNLLPLIVTNNGYWDRYYTGVAVTNRESFPAKVTFAFSPNRSGNRLPDCEPGNFPRAFTIPPGGNIAYIQASDTPGSPFYECAYVGSAQVRAVNANNPSQPARIISLVNQVAKWNQAGSTYVGMTGAGAYKRLAAPLVMAYNGGYWSGISIQNSSPYLARVSVTFSPNTAGSDDCRPPTASRAIPPEDSWSLLQTESIPAGCRYVGSALITSDRPVHAIVNQVGPRTPRFDRLFTYSAFPVLGPLAYGLDISNYTGKITLDDVRCWVNSNQKHIIVKAPIVEEANYANRPIARQQLETLWHALDQGLKVSLDLYLYLHWPNNPATGITTPIRQQVREAIGILEELNVPAPSVGRLWIDLEEHPQWCPNVKDDPAHCDVVTTRRLLAEALDECGPFPCGIYTTKGWWGDTGNTTEFSGYPLWYAHHPYPANFDDWYVPGSPGYHGPFGGWTDPVAKQYARNPNLCGHPVDWDIVYLP